MTRRLHTTSALLAVAVLLSACGDAPSPTALPDMQPALSGGSGGGGGTKVAKPGRITGASAGATCDAGTSMGITIRRGANDRAEVVISVTASSIPTGPAIAPSTFPQTSLGGWWSVSVKNDATGELLTGFGSTTGLSSLNLAWTILGRTVTPGTHTFTMIAENQQANGVIDYATLIALPVHETCTASITVFAK